MTLLGTFGYDAIQDQYYGGLNITFGGVTPAPGFLNSNSLVDR